MDAVVRSSQLHGHEEAGSCHREDFTFHVGKALLKGPSWASACRWLQKAGHRPLVLFFCYDVTAVTVI